MEIVKLRRLGSSVVVTLPKSILMDSKLKLGDRVIIQSYPPDVIITPEPRKERGRK